MSCDGKGCGECTGGWVVYTACPMAGVDRALLDHMELVEDSEDGHWPILAGTLDQCHQFRELRRFVRIQQSKIDESKRAKR